METSPLARLPASRTKIEITTKTAKATMQVIFQTVQLLFTLLFLYIVVRGIVTTYRDADEFINSRRWW